MKQQQSSQIRDILKIEERTRKNSLREFTHRRNKNYNFSDDQLTKFADILALDNKAEKKQLPRFGSLPSDDYLKVGYDFNINGNTSLNQDLKGGYSKLTYSKSNDFESYLSRANESSSAQQMISQDTSYSETDLDYSDQSQTQSQTHTSRASQVSNLKVELEALEENNSEGLQDMPSFRDQLQPAVDENFDDQIERKLMQQWQYVDQKYREGELDMYGGDDTKEDEEEYLEFDREVERSLSFGNYVDGGLSQVKQIYQQQFGCQQEQEEFYDEMDDHMHEYEEYDEYDQPITEQDYIGEYNNHQNFRFDDKKHSKSYSTGMTLFHDLSSTGLEDIPEEEEEEQLQEIAQPYSNFDTQESGNQHNSRRLSMDAVTPEARRTPGLNLEVINLELETALQDTEQQVASLRTQLRNKDIQVEQLQTALLSYGEQQFEDASSNIQADLKTQQNNACQRSSRPDSPRELILQQPQQHRTAIRSRDVLEKVMERSMRLMESQHKRELQKMEEEVKVQDELIESMKLERDHMDQDILDMQFHYEDQIKILEQHTDALIIEQDALEQELQQALRELQKSQHECDHLNEKLIDANRLIANFRCCDASVTSIVDSATPHRSLQPPRRNPQPHPHPSPDMVFSETTTFGSVQSSCASPVQQCGSSPNGVCGNYLNEEIKKQITSLSQTTHSLVRHSSDLQETLARCRELDMNVERCVAAACSNVSPSSHRQVVSDNHSSSTQSKVLNTTTTTSSISPHKLFAHAKKKLFKKRRDSCCKKEALPQAVEPSKPDSQNLKELQICVQDLKDNLQKAIKTADGLNQQKLLLHQRIQILETCLNSQQPPQDPESSNPPLDSPPPPQCQTLEEAIEYISRIHHELHSTKQQLQKSEQDNKELVQTLAQISDEKINAQEQKLMEEQQQQQQQETNSSSLNQLISRSNQLPTQSSVGSGHPDAIQIAEEMSKKVVILQSEKEELEEALNQMQLDNFQLKQVKEQLEGQVTALVQQTNGGVVTGKRRLGGLLRGMGKT